MRQRFVTSLAAILLLCGLQACSPFDSNNGKITAIEEQAKFPGGIEAFYKYLNDNLHYPDIDKKANIQGRVIVSFVVNKDGSLTQIEVRRPVSPTIDSEAVRIIRASPRWEPGTQNHKPVQSMFTLPISFTLP